MTDQRFEIERLRALLTQAGIDPEASAIDRLDGARAENEALRQENARLRQDAARTTGNYRLALSFGQAKLAASEAEIARFDAILQSAIDFAIIVMDLSGQVTTWNEGATRILGWSTAEIEGQHIRTIFTPEDVTQGIAERELTQALVKDRANDERWHIRKSGERFFAMGTMMPLRADDGTTLGFMKILRDETPRRLAEEQFRQGEAFTRSILASSRDAIVVLDFDGRITAFNENGRLLVGSGLGEPELAESDPAALEQDLWAEAWQAAGEPIAKAMDIARAGETGRFQCKRVSAGGSVTWWDCVITPVASVLGSPRRLLAVSRDITEDKQAEHAIAESAHRLRTILDTVPVGLLIADADGTIVDGNQRVDEILKHTAVRAYGDLSQDRWQAFHADGRPVHRDDYPLPQVLKKGMPRASLEVDYHKGDGTRGWVLFEAAAVTDTLGATTGAVVAIMDIDARKQSEARQHVLMGELSHRVKNILAVVVSIARQTLRSAQTMPEASEALLSRINALAGAHDVLMQHHWTSADMRTLVAGAVKVQDDAGRQVAISGPDLRLGPQAALSLALVIHELGTNAVKYGALSGAAGRVDVVWTTEMDLPEPRLSFQWRESGGPSVTAPAQTGFGSRLVKHSLSSFGTVTMTYAETGFVLDFSAPLKRVQQIDKG